MIEGLGQKGDIMICNIGCNAHSNKDQLQQVGPIHQPWQQQAQRTGGSSDNSGVRDAIHNSNGNTRFCRQ